MKFEKVLVVVAHPDDETLGCGGTMAKYAAQGSDVRVLILGEGTSCRYDVSQLDSAEVAQAIDRRTNCARKAMEILSVRDCAFIDHPCGRFDQVPIIEIGKTIESAIADFGPDLLITHSSSDVNNDHRLTYQAALQATRPGAQNLVRTLYTTEILSSSEWRFDETFKPNVFEELDESLVELKAEAFACFDTECRPLPFPRCREGIFSIARMRGMQSGGLYAEAFQLVREIRV